MQSPSARGRLQEPAGTDCQARAGRRCPSTPAACGTARPEDTGPAHGPSRVAAAERSEDSRRRSSTAIVPARPVLRQARPLPPSPPSRQSGPACAAGCSSCTAGAAQRASQSPNRQGAPDLPAQHRLTCRPPRAVELRELLCGTRSTCHGRHKPQADSDRCGGPR